jgi:Flp pilus assembly protein TadG
MKSWLFVGKLLPSHRQNQRGQTLVIFAFLAIFMLLLLGLVLDSARLFILTAQAQRVAEAASLAGALYMPTYFDSTTPAPDGQYAVKRACDVAKENGITNCPAANGQVGAAVSKVTGNQYELQVTVTLQANVFFLAYISPSLSSATVSRPAIAEYLPSIKLGSRYSYFGDQADNNQSFWAYINGPYELQEHGDAYTPKWQEGPTDPQKYPDGGSRTFNRWTPTVGSTNHQQWVGGYITNPDQHPAGFTGPDGKLGYNYQIIIPQGSPQIEVQIYNPAFDPDDANTGDGLDSACFDPAYSGCVISDNANEYMQMTYSLYSAPLLFERSQDTLLTSKSYASLDLIGTDLTVHGCKKAYDPVAKTCVSNPSYVDAWTILTDAQGNKVLLGPGTYRLVVEASGYYGRHGYGIKLTDVNGKQPPSGVAVWGWNDMCVHFNITGGTAVFDLGEIPADYAGKTLNFSLFDPGDATSGDIKMQILDPSGNPVKLPSWVRTFNNDRVTLWATNNGDEIYNGLWLKMPITIPSTYNPTSGNDWWTIKYMATGTPSDTITISISLSGSPIHLVNEVL